MKFIIITVILILIAVVIVILCNIVDGITAVLKSRNSTASAIAPALENYEIWLQNYDSNSIWSLNSHIDVGEVTPLPIAEDYYNKKYMAEYVAALALEFPAKAEFLRANGPAIPVKSKWFAQHDNNISPTSTVENTLASNLVWLKNQPDQMGIKGKRILIQDMTALVKMEYAILSSPDRDAHALRIRDQSAWKIIDRIIKLKSVAQQLQSNNIEVWRDLIDGNNQ
jgi:hypothetical protein